MAVSITVKGAKMTIRMAIPNKGRLYNRTVDLLIKSGLDFGEEWGRKLYITAKNQDIEVVFIRVQDIPKFINSGSVDLGITGQDQIINSGYNLEEILDLGFGYCRLSVAAPEKSGIKTIDDIKDGYRIATSFSKITKKFFDAKGKKVKIIEVGGSAEIMPYMDVSDAIVDLVSSGLTLRMNGLVEIETIAKSQAVVVTSKDALSRSKSMITDIVSSIRSVIEAESKKYLMADVPASKLEEIKKLFPGVEGPTVMKIYGRDDMVAIHVVIEKNDVYSAVNTLQKMGSKGILTVPIDRMVQ